MAAVRPRAIWTGSISFGLVNAPVRMYAAVSEKNLKFNLIHEKDGGRIGYQKICKLEDKTVPNEEIVKAYQVDEDEFVYLHDEDFEAAAPESYKTITIHDFVPSSQIDPIYFERTYYLGPADGGEKVYRLLAQAMDQAGLAGIGTYVMRNKQHLGCLRVRDGLLTLSKMYFADEIRPTTGLAPSRAKVSKQELEMAAELIDRFTTRFDITKYSDSYRKALLAVIKRKQKGKAIPVATAPDEAAPPDLLAALRESVERHSRPEKGSRSRNGGLEKLTKTDLEKRAKRKKIKGYSRMTKDELVAELR
jgi:DNA end-binding protein Ku